MSKTKTKPDERPTPRGLMGTIPIRALARAVETSPTTIMAWMKGDGINLETALRIADALGVHYRLVVDAWIDVRPHKGERCIPSQGLHVTPHKRCVLR